ncbi:hypothetical protein, partial [Brevibacterium paucivorans]
MSLTEPSDVRRQVDAALREGLNSTASRFTALSPTAEDATSPAALEARNDLRRDVMFGQFLDIYVQDAPVPAADVTDRA